ncbi:MAG: hypothetical protein BMS9Abin18_0177 [Zetaproteobacteria bacterium]|nr:MAG: hypothetical protein BMS9Abin18_0177 [Zetaproteobacteria bacterium]
MTDLEEIPSNYTWTDNYLVNIYKVDDQHKALFATAAKLYKLLLGHEDLKEIDKIFSSLIRQTLVHFQTEEELMKTHGYPDYPHHKELHDILVQQLKDMQSSQQTIKSLNYLQPWIERLEVADYLSGWLINHIIDEDKKFGVFLQDNGIE